MKEISEETIQFLNKIIIPAIIAVVTKIAIKMSKGQATLSNSLLSMIIGVSMAYLCGEWITETVNTKYTTLTVAFIAITSDKIGSWFVFKIQIDAFLSKLFNALGESLSNFIKNINWK